MENAADALKMAFAMFVFIVALTMALSLIGKAKNTSDTVLLYSDKTIYQTFTDGNLGTEEGRIVGTETVISTLYKMSDEQINVTIKGKTGTVSLTSTSGNDAIKTYINNNLTTGKKFTEQVVRVTTSGSYLKARNGTKIKIADDGDTSAGNTTTYVIYKEI